MTTRPEKNNFSKKEKITSLAHLVSHSPGYNAPPP